MGTTRTRVFDEENVHWTKHPEVNRLFLETQQQYMNHLLTARGHLFLNEVFDALGFPRTSYGQLQGWIAGREPNIDFGLEHTPDFSCAVIHLCVQGEIYKEI